MWIIGLFACGLVIYQGISFLTGNIVTWIIGGISITVFFIGGNTNKNKE